MGIFTITPSALSFLQTGHWLHPGGWDPALLRIIPMGTVRRSLLKLCYAVRSSAYRGLSRRRRRQRDQIPLSLSPRSARSYTRACPHLDKRRCTTSGNALSLDEFIFPLVMLTGHTHTHANPLLGNDGRCQTVSELVEDPRGQWRL